MRWLVLIALCSGCFIKPDPPSPPGVDYAPAIGWLAAGETHVCWVDPSTQLWCWGRGDAGELGVSPPPKPTGKPRSLGTGWTYVAAGGEQTCGIQNGLLLCWGQGAASSSNTPQQVALDDGVIPKRVVVGTMAICVFDANSMAYCFGEIEKPGHTDSSPLALLSVGGRTGPWATVAFGDDHTCAVDNTTHELLCWGSNDNGELALGATGDDVPIDNAMPAIFGDNTFVDVAAKTDVTCAITTSHQLVSGNNEYSLSDGPGFSSIGTRRDWTRDALGTNHSCAIAGGDVFCYGYDQNGTMGDGFASHDMILGASVYSNALAVVSGGLFVCATDGSGVKCWGANDDGQLGNGEVAASTSPSQVDLGAVSGPYTSITTGFSHSCVLAGQPMTRYAYCWGDNRGLQVQPSPTNDAPVLAPAQSSTQAFVQLAAGATHTCGLEDNLGAIDCWGTNALGGTGAYTTVRGVAMWSGLAVGDDATCAVDSNHAVWCWGTLPWMQETATNVQTPVPGPSQWDLLAVGTARVLTTELANDAVASVGYQCSTNISVATDLTPALSANQVAASKGASYQGQACALTPTAISCWGTNDLFQSSPAQAICLDTPSTIAPPVGRSWMPTPGALSLAGRHSCALDNTGILYCWGENAGGALGDLPYISANLTQVSSKAWSEVSTGPQHTCAIAADQMSVWCWGTNSLGQIGLSATFQPTPVDVVFQ